MRVLARFSGQLYRTSLIVLVAGIIFTAYEIYNHLQHPEYSAPWTVNLVILIPFAVLSLGIYLLARWASKNNEDS